jgi:hypothetical protein
MTEGTLLSEYQLNIDKYLFITFLITSLVFNPL